MDDTTGINFTRRKALAAIGSIGVASAGAGLGTSAYFSDQETFENNQLTAGTLDMNVAATEYYSDWSPDEAEYAGMAADAAATDIRLPASEAQTDAQDIAIDIDGENYANFFGAISTDANGEPYNRVNGGVAAANDGGLCGTGSAADGPVIVDISDVKPGDFGGAQFAFELCDNPGYVWLTGGLRDANENGTNEPEADDPDEQDGVVELLDEIQVAYGVGPINGDTSAFDDTDAGFQPVEQSTLREFLAALNGEGVALDGDIDAEIGGGTGEQGCFSGGNPDDPSLHEVSVVWWLPIDHGNQVQSDSVTFDLGFYTEQCRHNDGTTDLVAYYPFEGSANDLSGNGYDGSLVNGAPIGTGRDGQVLVLDGSDDHVVVPDDPTLDLTDAFSVAAWVNAPQTQSSYARLVSREQSGAGNRQYNLGFTPGGQRPRTVVDTGNATGVEASGTTVVTDGSWHHVATTFDSGDSLRLYVDGALEEQTPVNASVVSRASDVVLGGIAHTPTNLQYTGLVDDVRIYSRALSASEIQSLYDSD